MTAKSDIHNTIVLSAAPAGRFLEGILNAASGLLPGHAMEIDAAVEPAQGGKHTWQAYSGTSGHRKLIAILMEAEMIGKTISDTCSDDTKVRMYCPIPGDELLVLVSATGTGTGDAVAIGDKLILASGGTFIKTADTPEAEPFEVLETLADVVAAGTLCHVIFTGN